MIHHIVDRLDEETGGPARSVPLLARHLQRLGLACAIATRSGFSNPLVRTAHHHGVRVLTQWAWMRTVIRGLRRGDVVHFHGMWSPVSAGIAFLCLRRGAKMVCSPRGMLEPWSIRHRFWKKALAWRIYEKWFVRKMACFHVTSSAELQSIRRIGRHMQIRMVPNGVDEPPGDRLPPLEERPKNLIFLSRIHQKKGVEVLLSAVALARADLAAGGWRVTLTGSGNPVYVRRMMALADDLGLGNLVEFLGPAPETCKWERLFSGRLFVLPTFSENFGIVIGEAMAAGLPVITTRHCPWSIITHLRSGWIVDPQAEELAAVLREAIACAPSLLEEMGMRGAQHIAEKYRWDAVASAMRKVYAAAR